MKERQSTLDNRFGRLRWPLLAVGVIIGALSAVLGVGNLEQLLRSYLWVYFFWLGLTLGCMGLAMLHHVAGGAWGAVMLRFLEAGMLTMPLMAILFVPIVLGMRYLYPWTASGTAPDSSPQQVELYLNIPFFIARAVFYFLTWLVTMYFLRRWSLDRDRTMSARDTRRLQVLSIAAGLLYCLTASFAAIDWVMSLEPQWYSTVYPMMNVVGMVLTAFAFVVLLVALLDEGQSLVNLRSPALFNDLGSLLLAFCMIWAYLAYSQFMLIWAGDLNQEIPWYVHRLAGGWQWVALAVALFSFVVPFILLIMRDLKRNSRLLAGTAAILFIARVINGYWLVMPSFQQNGLALSWLDVALLIGMGCLWLGVYFWQLAARPLVATGDYTLQSVADLAHESQH